MKSHDQLWHTPPDQLTLPGNEVHVWRVSLAMLANNTQHFQHILIDEEIKRARQFYFEKDRQYWMVAHAVLRIVLGWYLKYEPHELRFVTNDYGKPSIASPLTGKRLQFNLSHSGSLALYAVSYERDVGVDVEQIRDGIDYSGLATRFFSDRERTALARLPATLQEEAFFLCWSRKEAYIKARGMGLSLSLQQFDVSLTPNESAKLIASREEPQATERWSLQALFPGRGYAGALVAEGFDWQLCCWQWPAKMDTIA